MKKPFYARSTPWGTIQIGDRFKELSEKEQAAVLAHEHGHIHHRHALRRLGWILTLRAFRKPDEFFALCEAQELEADRYAAKAGHSVGLIAFLLRRKSRVKSPGYPTAFDRVEAVRNCIDF